MMKKIMLVLMLTALILAPVINFGINYMDEPPPEIHTSINNYYVYTPENFPPENYSSEEDETTSPPEIIIPPLPEPIHITLESLLFYNPSMESGRLELPVVGATGWAATYIPLLRLPYLPVTVNEAPENTYNDDLQEHEYNEQLDEYYERSETYDELDEVLSIDYEQFDEEYTESEYDTYDTPSAIIETLPPGTAFVILDTHNEWWNVQLPHGATGWVISSMCFINLPDVIPSIVYNISNAHFSLLRSSGFDIPNISGHMLYNAWAFNERLGRQEFIVPALYHTSHRLFAAQQAALRQGDTIVVYEVFRPHATQQSTVSNLQYLIRQNEIVEAALNTPPWSPNWFISHGTSNHQRGAAIDASLARVTQYELRFTGDFAYRHITGFTMHHMPTAMHELHPSAATFTGPRTNIPADTMTEGALLLQRYFTQAGFNPLASEWWHFDDPIGISIARGHNMLGNFNTETIYSVIPATYYYDYDYWQDHS